MAATLRRAAASRRCVMLAAALSIFSAAADGGDAASSAATLPFRRPADCIDWQGQEAAAAPLVNFMQVMAMPWRRAREVPPHRTANQDHGLGLGHGSSVLPWGFMDEVASINKTYTDVGDLTLAVNTAIATVADLFVGSVEALETAVVQARTRARMEELDTLPLDWGKAFKSTGLAIAKVMGIKAESSRRLIDTRDDFGVLAKLLTSSYLNAGDLVRKAVATCHGAKTQRSPSSSAAALMQLNVSIQDEVSKLKAAGPIEWMRSFFHREETPPTIKATETIYSAMIATEHVRESVLSLNGTLSTFLAEASRAVSNGMSEVSATISNISNGPEGMPQTVQEAYRSTQTTAGFVKSQLENATVELREDIAGAFADLQPLQKAAQHLLGLLSLCAAATATR